MVGVKLPKKKKRDSNLRAEKKANQKEKSRAKATKSTGSTRDARMRSTLAKKPASTRATNGTGLFLALIGVLCVFGLMMVLSSSSVDALRHYNNSWMFFNKQLLWMLLGGAALVFMSRFDYRRLRALGMLLVAVSVVLLVLVLIPGIGVTVYGSRRWLGAGMFRMQPSELAKFAILVFSADLMARRQHLVSDWRATLRPIGFIWFGLAALVMIEPDMGTTLILTAVTLVVIFVGGTPNRLMVRILGGGVAAAALFAIVEPYRRRRLLAFMHPFRHADDEGYQIVQSFYAIASGGIGGVGIGASRAKWGFLPNSYTDFIFAIIAEELGLVGALAVVALFLCFAALGVRTATRAPDQFGMLMAAGITTWVVLQAFLNIGAVIGILPVTGVPLPFISQGGSSLVILMAASGVLINISRQGENIARPRRRATDPTDEELIDIR